MNLHVVPDDKYVSRFVERIGLLGLGANNVFAVKSSKPYRYLKQPLPELKELPDAGDQYDKVFIHFLDEESIDIVLNHNWSKIYWLAWGADVYESLYSPGGLVDDATEKVMQVTLRNKLNRFVYSTGEKILKYKKFKAAYSKVEVLACWVKEEYDLARNNFPGLNAAFHPFIYESDTSFERLRAEIPQHTADQPSGNVRVLLGQSTMPAGNHMSALEILREKKSVAGVFIPASYGSPQYLDRLENATAGKFPFEVSFLKTFQPFKDYVAFMLSIDAVVLHSRRPAGLGNFWIGIFLGKVVFLRRENLAFKILHDLGLKFFALDEWRDVLPGLTLEEKERNREICLEFFSEDRIGAMYTDLFR